MQLRCSTPSKKLSFHDSRTDEIQQSPRCKMSKSKVIHKLAKNKLIIDFDLEKTYSLAEIDTTQYFKGEEKDHFVNEEYSDNKSYLCSTNATSGWRYTSPFQTARKARITSANMSEFTSVIKESRFCRNFDQQSPFCRLLNDSDQNTVDKYQSLLNDEEAQEEENLYEKVIFCDDSPRLRFRLVRQSNSRHQELYGML